MKPTRAGYWWYKGIPAEVRYDETIIDPLWFEAMGAWKNNFDNDLHGPVSHTNDEDWGPEILPPCKDRCQVCCNDNRPCYGECRHKEITRNGPDEKPTNDGNDSAG